MSAANTPPRPGEYSPARTTGTPYPAPGTWPDPYTVTTRTTYEPTAEQLARDAQRRHYLRRNVYTPAILAAVIFGALLVLVIVLAFGVGTPAARSLIAGLSGLTIILFAIPLTILMAILPIAYLAFVLNRRQQRKLYPETGPMAYRSRLQILLWRLDSLLAQTGRLAERGGYAVERPLVRAHAQADYVKEFVRGIKRNFTRSNPNEFNG